MDYLNKDKLPNGDIPSKKKETHLNHQAAIINLKDFFKKLTSKDERI